MGKGKSPIPIKNLFYMLCYAWNVLSIFDNVKVSDDDYDDAYDLLARVFAYGLGRMIRSGFHRSYIEKKEEKSSIRGKILMQESVNLLSMQKHRLMCVYDEYSKNDLFNRVLKYTIELLLHHPNVSAETKKELKCHSVYFEGIDSVPPTKPNRQKLIFNRNDVTYKLLISVALMLYDETAVNEHEGKKTFRDFFREEQLHKVFELFILNFYAMHLDGSKYKVHAPKINWHIEENADEIWNGLFDVDKNPGDRRTDIVIENKELNLQMIFDAKYYKKTFVNGYMGIGEDHTRTSHLNQVRGYLLDSDYSGNKVGALIYPMVNNDLQKGKVHPIQDTPVIIKTINLNVDWRDIERDMLDFVYRIEEVNRTQKGEKFYGQSDK